MNDEIGGILNDTLPRRYAHSLQARPLSDWEPLGEHSAAVARRAAAFATVFGCTEIAKSAGLLHDIGKCSQAFQEYIRQAVDPDRRVRGPDHSTAGARVASAQAGSPVVNRMLALVIAGHHAGLMDPDDLQRRLDPESHPIPGYAGWEADAGLPASGTALQPTHRFPKSTIPMVGKGFSQAFLIRMLFSCLVDADFLETERFMQGGTIPRGVDAELAGLRSRLAGYMSKLRAEAKPTPLNSLRAEILDFAMGKASMAPGFFTLTVPTGGGKTLASLFFALEHARAHGLRRIVYVIPYTSIIEQTADVFRKALGDDSVVLEHHASFDWERAAKDRASDACGGTDAVDRLRRAAENWDAPVIVTTAVQFFESLFANRTSACRKLHNLADSVIVLDEAQTLPLPVLRPCLAALDELRRCFGASIVLCTATQPAWRRLDHALIDRIEKDTTRANLGLDIDATRELAPRPSAIYRDLKRVRIEAMDDPVDDARIAARFAEIPQMLCIVNSRAHASDLFRGIANLCGAVHLTTLMCPAHRRQVLATLRQRLKDGQPVRLVATSLIEAGVDISFPEVWRAWTGMDSIAQAAGRCNREGELVPNLGRVVVFEPMEHKPPPQLRVFQQAARKVVRDNTDPLTLDAVAAYFRELYFAKGIEDLDAKRVGGTRGVLAASEEGGGSDCRIPFKSIAEAFRLIDDVMEPVAVPWDEKAETLMRKIASTPHAFGADLRQLQQYTVGIPKKAHAEWLVQGVLRPVRADLGAALLRFEDLSHYRAGTGVDLGDSTHRDAERNVW